jgi:hypothetical protein
LNWLSHYIEILKTLQENKIPFAVTGTFALYLQNKKFSEQYELKDCDIFIEYTSEALTSFVGIMRDHDWSVKIWEEEAIIENLLQQAEGKYYIRCTKENLILDGTYDYEKDKFGDMKKDLIYQEGLPMICASKILEGKKYRGTERDLLAVEVFNSICI